MRKESSKAVYLAPYMSCTTSFFPHSGLYLPSKEALLPKEVTWGAFLPNPA